MQMPKLRRRNYWMVGGFFLVFFLLLLWHHPASLKVDTTMTVASQEQAILQSRPVVNKEDVPYCPNFAARPPPLTWEEIYALEWNGTPTFPAMSQSSTLFPTTQFTSHVEELVRLIDIDAMEATCFWKFTLTVNQPFSRPTNLSCQGKARQRMVPWWCIVLERLFFQNTNPANDTASPTPNHYSANLLTTTGQRLDPILPTSISFAVSSDDYYQHPHQKHHKGQRKRQSSLSSTSPFTCLANSAPNGTFCITNFLELQRMADHTTYPILPWHQRCSKPIWRGSAWIQPSTTPVTTTTSIGTTTNSTTPILDQALRDCPRCRVVEFSHRFPHLLDAKFGDDHNGFFHPAHPHYVHWWQHNATNGLHVLLPIHHIPSSEYYVHYQTVLVLCGWGAAFRTSIHFSTATAVILQDCPFQEWYHPWLVPWKHYIPLDYHFSNLPDLVTWIPQHPSQVHAIARAGREFYQTYLSFQRNYEHFYEWIYRLALEKQDRKKDQKLTRNVH